MGKKRPHDGSESLRLVIDHREINKITLKDNYPTPRTHHLIDRLGKAERFPKVDFTSGSYQAQVVEAGQWKTACRTRRERFSFPLCLSG